jgi:hypothetical protein
MKTCLICHSAQPADAPTCSECGEASWSDADASAVVDDAAVPVTPSVAPRGLRTRKGG